MPNTKEMLRAELAELFQVYDADANGRIDRGEFERLLRRLGEATAPERVARQFASIDIDGDGGIDFDEFAAWWLES